MGKLARIFFTGRASRKPTDRQDSEIKPLWRAFSDGGNRTQLPGRIPGWDATIAVLAVVVVLGIGVIATGRGRGGGGTQA